MAKCDEGYLCDVCGDEVEAIIESDLYLRFVLGEISPLRLQNSPERHIRCNPALAQYIVDESFPTVVCDSVFAKEHLDPTDVQAQEEKITRAWRRLQELPRLGLPIHEYPLPEVVQHWYGKKH